MPCTKLNPGETRAGGDGQDPRVLSRPTHLERTGSTVRDRSPFRNRTRYPVIEVGDSRFTVKTEDRLLIKELRLYGETLRGDFRAEVRFTNKLLSCTEEGRLQPWGWQRQTCKSMQCCPGP